MAQTTGLLRDLTVNVRGSAILKKDAAEQRVADGRVFLWTYVDTSFADAETHNFYFKPAAGKKTHVLLGMHVRIPDGGGDPDPEQATLTLTYYDADDPFDAEVEGSEGSEYVEALVINRNQNSANTSALEIRQDCVIDADAGYSQVLWNRAAWTGRPAGGFDARDELILPSKWFKVTMANASGTTMKLGFWMEWWEEDDA